MRNKFLLLSFVLLLAGCHLEKPYPMPLPAKALLVNDEVCVFIASEKSEVMKVYAISIDKAVGEKKYMFEKYSQENHDYISAKANDCIPTLGYRFEIGKIYHIAVYALRPGEIIDNDPAKRKNYEASILIELDKDNNKILKSSTKWGWRPHEE